MASPLLILFTCSIAMGCIATLIVVVAVSVDSWEYSSYHGSTLRSINQSQSCSKLPETKDCTEVEQLSVDPPLFRFNEYYRQGSQRGTNDSTLLYSTSSGLWRTCDDLTDSLRSEYVNAAETNYNGQRCFVFVTDYNEESSLLKEGSKQIARLQNSAASCYIVVLIDLTSAAVVGIIGIGRKQVASCMVTGVLYLMAALFGVFGLSMFHTKDYYEKFQCYALDEIPEQACYARVVEIGFAVPMAWVGVVACALACAIWLCVSRALRVIKAKTML
ncbi:uncharacterized protein LOC101862021 [Aplysia californica]|uniref:Uncharacterized protein LOC101862021 n=1 Tax=Aplysia californica TaxID=6500 RepID=A0ABM0JIU5_APLCA|nr:uncharacterized protein LOC101862021 [Aplysia californica]